MSVAISLKQNEELHKLSLNEFKVSTHLHKFLNRLQHLYVKGFGLNSTQVHVTQEAVDDL